MTHGREEALIHEVAKRGVVGRALRLLGYGEEEDLPGMAEAGAVPPAETVLE